MDWGHISTGWKRYCDRVKEQWTKLTTDDLEAINGDRDKLIDRIQLRYGVQREEAEVEFIEWLEVIRIRGS